MLEAPEDRTLAEMLVPPLRTTLYGLSAVDKAKHLATKALRGLQAFASTLELKVGELELGVREPAFADSGNLQADLPELLVAVAEAADQAEMPVAVFIDEVQYLATEDLSALLASIHKIGQKQLPFVVFGAGLPQLAGLAGEAKSYAERLFDYPTIGPLSHEAAERAIRAPIQEEGAEIDDAALASILSRTQRYAYFLQEWGSQAWDAASNSTITEKDVDNATANALKALDQGFFRVRFDRLKPSEKNYLRAMADLGAGPHRSGDIAGLLGVKVMSAGPLRSGLIKKGMIYSPQYGDTAFTVPMFDEFMRRMMPDWRSK